MRPCRLRWAVIQLQRAPPPARVMCTPHVGLVKNGSQPKSTGLVPETTNTTLYSGSFGSGVDEERS